MPREGNVVLDLRRIWPSVCGVLTKRGAVSYVSREHKK